MIFYFFLIIIFICENIKGVCYKVCGPLFNFKICKLWNIFQSGHDVYTLESALWDVSQFLHSENGQCASSAACSKWECYFRHSCTDTSPTPLCHSWALSLLIFALLTLTESSLQACGNSPFAEVIFLKLYIGLQHKW